MKIEALHKLFLASTGVCTDTRALKPGQLYVALKGDNFNGNAFAKAALDQGASYAIIDEDIHTSSKTILVDDALKTLQDLAQFHRNYLKIPIIGLTGSNGKTTTKELINAVLSQAFTTVATKGNLNNHIGVPLTLLSMSSNTEIGIVEMGANHKGEIAMLSQIAQPNIGYITNFGKAHLEGFGGEEGVIIGKSELYDYLRKTEGIAIVNEDDPIQLGQSSGIERLFFGEGERGINIATANANPWVSMRYKDSILRSQLIGTYNGPNIAAAVAIGVHFKLKLEEIKKGIETYTPTNNRSQIVKKGDRTIIMDAYNANPTSMEAALKNLKSQEATCHIAFLGDMFEVGRTAKAEHLRIAQIATHMKFDEIHLVGSLFYNACFDLEKVITYENFDDFKQNFKGLSTGACTILIKGSRGMAMERVLDLL